MARNNLDLQTQKIIDGVKYILLKIDIKGMSYRKQLEFHEIQQKFTTFENNVNEFFEDSHNIFDSIKLNMAVNKFKRNIMKRVRNG